MPNRPGHNCKSANGSGPHSRQAVICDLDFRPLQQAWKLANTKAKLRSSITCPSNDITHRTLVRRKCCSPNLHDSRPKEAYTTDPDERLEAEITKTDIVDPIRYRSGHHPSFGRWQHMRGRTEEIQCRLCGEDENSREYLAIVHCSPVDLHHHRLEISMDELVHLP